MTDPADEQPYYLAPRDVAAVFSAVAPHYDDSAVVAREVRTQLLERLDVVALEPAVIVEAGVATGASLPALRQRYPESVVLAVDIAGGMLAQAARDRALTGVHFVNADCHALPLCTDSVDMVFSNLMLGWCHDPEAVLRECRRVLKPGGLLTFSTFGPDTLKEMRAAWARVDKKTHVHYFYDMHDIGDALQRAGFGGPVMDVDYYTLTYADAVAAMRDLKATGANNLTAGRPRGLTGRRRFESVVRAYDAFALDDRVPATYEIIYGHAFAPQAAPQARLGDGAIGIPVSHIRRPGGES